MRISELMQDDTRLAQAQEGGGNAPNQEPAEQVDPAISQQQPIDGGADSDIPTDEEAEIYERIALAGLKIINGSSDQILAMIQAGDNVPQSLADTIWMIMSTIDEQAGGQLDEEILLSASADVLEAVADLAQESGAVEINQSTVAQATQIILARFSEEFGVDFGEEMGAEVQASDEATLKTEMGI